MNSQRNLIGTSRSNVSFGQSRNLNMRNVHTDYLNEKKVLKLIEKVRSQRQLEKLSIETKT